MFAEGLPIGGRPEGSVSAPKGTAAPRNTRGRNLLFLPVLLFGSSQRPLPWFFCPTPPPPPTPRSMLCLPRCHRHVSPVASPCQQPLPTSLRAHHGGFASCPEQWTCTQQVPAADCLHLCSSVGKREGQRLGQEMETPYVKQKLCCPRAGVWGQSLCVTPSPSRCCCNNNNELLQTLSDFSPVSLRGRSTNVA